MESTCSWNQQYLYGINIILWNQYDFNLIYITFFIVSAGFSWNRHDCLNPYESFGITMILIEPA